MYLSSHNPGSPEILKDFKQLYKQAKIILIQHNTSFVTIVHK
jgi:hypothetical protein